MAKKSGKFNSGNYYVYRPFPQHVKEQVLYIVTRTPTEPPSYQCMSFDNITSVKDALASFTTTMLMHKRDAEKNRIITRSSLVNLLKVVNQGLNGDGDTGEYAHLRETLTRLGGSTNPYYRINADRLLAAVYETQKPIYEASLANVSQNTPTPEAGWDDFMRPDATPRKTNASNTAVQLQLAVPAPNADVTFQVLAETVQGGIQKMLRFVAHAPVVKEAFESLMSVLPPFVQLCTTRIPEPPEPPPTGVSKIT